MIALDWTFFALAIPAVIFAGVSKGGFGSGAAFASAAILALILPPGLALGVMLPLLMVIDFAALPPFWRKWDTRASIHLTLGAIPGVALGAWLYTIVDADVFRVLIGATCLAFVSYQVARARGWLRVSNWRFSAPWAWFAGAAAGFNGFVSHAGGPALAVYLLGAGFDKTRYQATTIIVFLIINLMKGALYAALGLFTPQTLTADLFLAPFAIFGAWLGVRAHDWVSEAQFLALTYVLLTLTGLRLIWVALT